MSVMFSVIVTVMCTSYDSCPSPCYDSCYIVTLIYLSWFQWWLRLLDYVFLIMIHVFLLCILVMIIVWFATLILYAWITVAWDRGI